MTASGFSTLCEVKINQTNNLKLGQLYIVFHTNMLSEAINRLELTLFFETVLNIS